LSTEPLQICDTAKCHSALQRIYVEVVCES
jgi:hypothetical protein